MWAQIAGVLLPPLLILGQTDQPGQTAPTAEEINRAIEGLGDRSFGLREQAFKLVKRCVELAPRQEQFRWQLERFQGP